MLKLLVTLAADAYPASYKGLQGRTRHKAGTTRQSPWQLWNSSLKGGPQRT